MKKIVRRSKTYGIPYMGSKSAIAEWVVSHFLQRDNFYDLFAGGCAVTHAALLLRNFKRYVINDINPMPTQLFLDAIGGKYKDENRWISRDDFERLKYTDALVAYIWSFGNNQNNYMYGKDIEPFKKAFHYAVFFKDYSLFKELGYNINFIEKYQNIDERCRVLRKYFKGLKLKINYNLQDYNQLERIKNLESLERLQRLQSLERLQSDYRDVKIVENSVIYCDIPYENTAEYKGAEGFNHDEFEDWANQQTEPLYVSSYEIKRNGFVEIDKVSKQQLLSARNNTKVLERLYVPRKQVESKLIRI